MKLDEQALAQHTSTSFPHGVVTGEDGRRTLYVNEYKIRSIDHANRLRGLRADQVCTFRDRGMPQRIRDYLEQEVLAPLIADMKDSNPPKDPPHQSADWALWVVKRVEALEAWRQFNAKELATNTASSETVEQLFKRVEGLEKGEADSKVAREVWELRLSKRTEKVESAHASHSRRLQGLEMSEHNVSDWRNAVSARLNAIEIWKNSELAALLTEKVAAIERVVAQVEGLQARCKELQGYAEAAASLGFVERVERIANENTRALNEQNETARKNAELVETLKGQMIRFDQRLTKEETRPDPDHRGRFMGWDSAIEKLEARLGSVEKDRYEYATLTARVHDLERHAHTGELPRDNPGAKKIAAATLDEAFGQWCASPWGAEHAFIEQAFASAGLNNLHHRELSAVMEASFRAGWNARKP